MVKLVLAVVCSVFFGSVARAGTSLGALRLGNGQAAAGGTAGAVAYDNSAGGAYYFEVTSTTTDDTEVTIETVAAVSIGDSDAEESITVSAVIEGPSYQTVYVPQATVGVAHLVNANADDGYAYTGYYGYSGGWGNAGDDFAIDDDEATSPCLTGFIDVIVATGAFPGPKTTAGSAVSVTVDRARVETGGTTGSPPTQAFYEVFWNDNLIATIYTPPGGDINMILMLVDCGYEDPVPLNAYAGTGYGATQPTYAYAPDAGGTAPSSLAQSIISVVGWFEVEDYSIGQEPTEGAWIQYYEGEGEEREPDGDPVELELE